MKNTIIPIILTVLVIGASALLWQNRKEPTLSTDSKTVCYIRNTEDGSKADIVLDVSGDRVTGKFDWLPAEKDSKTGSFEGTISSKDADGNQLIDSQLVTALWTASAEGKTAVEELRIVVGNGIAAPGFGEMKDRGDGVFVYAHPDSIVYGPNLSRADDCGTKLVPPTPPADTDAQSFEPRRVTLTGTQVCLPHKDTSGPQTLECAIGMRADDGKYYALDFGLMSQTPPQISNGQRFTASGVFVPIERLSTDHWRKYNMVGIFSVTNSVIVVPKQ